MSRHSIWLLYCCILSMLPGVLSINTSGWLRRIPAWSTWYCQGSQTGWCRQRLYLSICDFRISCSERGSTLSGWCTDSSSLGSAAVIQIECDMCSTLCRKPMSSVMPEKSLNCHSVICSRFFFLFSYEFLFAYLFLGAVDSIFAVAKK